MASNSAPVVDRIRIIPRPDDFLDRNYGNSGEVFFDKQTKTLRLYDGRAQGGFSVVTDKNIAELIGQSGVGVVDYTVTVVNQGEGNKYVIDGVYKPNLNFVIGYTYIFDQSDQTNEYYPNPEGGVANTHPLNFSADNLSGELGGGTTYLGGVIYKIDNDVVTKDVYIQKFEAATTRSVQITVTSATPTTLYYWCSNHLAMGGTITVAQPGSGAGGAANIEVGDAVPTDPQNGTLWFNSTTGKMYIYVTDVDSSQWVQPSVPIQRVNHFNSVTTGDSSQIYAVGESVLNFAAGPGIDISTDSSNTIQISASATGGGGGGGGASIGNFTLDASVIDTDDSSEITITPSLKLSSDLRVENDIRADNRIYASEFISTTSGAPFIDSATTITLEAPDGVLVEGELKLQNNNITGATTIDATTINASSITASQDLSTASMTFGTSAATGTHNIILANNSNNFAFQHNKFLSGEEVQYGRFNAGAKTALQFGTTTGGDTGQIFNSALSYISTTGFNFGDNNLNGYPLPYKMGVLDMTGATPSWTGGGESGIADNGNGDATITFSEDIASSTENFQVMATIQDQTTGHMVTISKPGVADIRVKVEDDAGTGVDAKVFLIIYKVT